jgi:hypothetical protein
MEFWQTLDLQESRVTAVISKQLLRRRVFPELDSMWIETSREFGRVATPAHAPQRLALQQYAESLRQQQTSPDWSFHR